MRKFLFLVLTIFIGLSQGRVLEEELHHDVPQIFTRNADINGEMSMLLGLKNFILLQCDLSMQLDKKDDLKTSITEKDECIKKETIFEVSKEEFIQHIDKCTEDTRTKMKSCLNESQQYFPDLLFALDKELILFKYILKDATMNDTIIKELRSCYDLIGTPNIDQLQGDCMDFSGPLYSRIIYTKEETCRSFAKYADCYREIVKPCEHFKIFAKLREDFLTFSWKPCTS